MGRSSGGVRGRGLPAAPLTGVAWPAAAELVLAAAMRALFYSREAISLRFVSAVMGLLWHRSLLVLPWSHSGGWCWLLAGSLE